MRPSEALNRSRDNLTQIVEGIERIQRYTAGMGLPDFLADHKTRDAVMRNVGVLGRLAGAIGQHEAGGMTRPPDVPWASLNAVGQLANRPYFEVDDEAVWHSIHTDLPPLYEAVKALLDSIGKP
ncbi:MAG: DUF86 domain-containing protein [Methylococcaceae bacterium]|jgi:uncharacterized protein with HEPN domain